MTDAEFRHDDAIVKKGAAEYAKVDAALAVVRQGIKNYIEVGEALQRIRRKIRKREDWKRLTADCSSFEEYVQKRLGVGRVRGYQLMDAAKTARLCQKECGFTPPTAAIASALADASPELLPELVEDCLRRGDKSTARQVGRSARNRLSILSQRERDANLKRRLQGSMEDSQGWRDWIDVRRADFADFLKSLPDKSVDLLLTDPEWAKVKIDYAKTLGEEAKRVLKPDGYLAVMAGVLTMPDWIDGIREGGMRYRWTIGYFFDTASAELELLNIPRSGWKPVLIFGATKRRIDKDVINLTKAGNVVPTKTRIDPIDGEITSVAPNATADQQQVWAAGDDFFKPDKECHKWGQNRYGFERLVKLLSRPGEVVVDCFCGSGQTLKAALFAMDGPRRVKGCDINKNYADLTRLDCRLIYDSITDGGSANRDAILRGVVG